MTEAPTQIKFEGKLLDLVALETVNTAPPEVQEYMTHLQIEIAKAFRVPDRYLMPPDVDREFQQRMWDATALLRAELSLLVDRYLIPRALVKDPDLTPGESHVG